MSEIVSTPANPGLIARTIDGVTFHLCPEGLTIESPSFGLVKLSAAESLAVITFARTAGVARLAVRSWLVTQHELAVEYAEQA